MMEKVLVSVDRSEIFAVLRSRTEYEGGWTRTGGLRSWVRVSLTGPKKSIQSHDLAKRMRLTVAAECMVTRRGQPDSWIAKSTTVDE